MRARVLALLVVLGGGAGLWLASSPDAASPTVDSGASAPASPCEAALAGRGDNQPRARARAGRNVPRFRDLPVSTTQPPPSPPAPEVFAEAKTGSMQAIDEVADKLGLDATKTAEIKAAIARTIDARAARVAAAVASGQPWQEELERSQEADQVELRRLLGPTLVAQMDQLFASEEAVQ